MGFEIKAPKNDKQVMTTKHCILHSMGKCILEHPEIKQSLPLTLTNAKDEYTLQFNCKACEMTVLLNSKDEVALH
jgi:23S rRNA 5-hydroxycytidine C2501 synthase